MRKTSSGWGGCAPRGWLYRPPPLVMKSWMNSSFSPSGEEKREIRLLEYSRNRSLCQEPKYQGHFFFDSNGVSAGSPGRVAGIVSASVHSALSLGNDRFETTPATRHPALRMPHLDAGLARR